MPEKLERCVDDIKGEKGEDSAYAICNSSIKEDQTVAQKHSMHSPFFEALNDQLSVADQILDMSEGGIGSGVKGHLSKAGALAGSYLPDIVTSGADVISGMGMTEDDNPMEIPFGYEFNEGGVGSGRKPEHKLGQRDPPLNPAITPPRTPRAKPAMPSNVRKDPMQETCSPCEQIAQIKRDILNAQLR